MDRTYLRLTTFVLALAAVMAIAAPSADAAVRDLPVEICNNQIDDDGDGAVDEQQCQLSPTGSPVSDNGIVPETWSDNPNCAQMGYSYGFKIEGQGAGDYTGTFTFTSSDGTLTGGAPQDGSNFVQLVSDGTYLSWSSSLPLDAVFMKGGPTGGNLYVYDPESQGPDSGLAVPNAANAISHVEFCYDYELDVSKDAAGSFDRTYSWTIQKDFDGSYDKNAGDPATTHDYTVSVDQTVADSNFAVSGTISIANPSPFSATIESVADVLNDGTAASVDCGVTFPYMLAAGADPLVCSYAAQPLDASATLNTVTVGTSGPVGGWTATAPVAFAVDNVFGYPTVTVSDTNGQAWAASGDTSWSYSRDFQCSSNPADYSNGFYTFSHVNTATITETGQSDIATVTVNCYAPVVTKDATATLDREYQWQITKGPDATYDDFIGDPANNHTYSITVTKSGEVIDSNWSVTGNISISNPGPLAMPLSSVVDSVGGVSAAVTCPAGTTVAPGATLQCTYVAITGLDGDETLNTATATLNGIPFSGTFPVSYTVENEINASINVTDAADGEPTVPFGPFSQTTTFAYSRDFQCPADPTLYTGGSYSVTRVNTATIDETGDSDNATVTLNCYAPVVTKTATGTYDERHDWQVEKTVSPATQNAFVGETGSFDWTVTVTETVVDENWQVTGSITVANGHPTETMELGALLDAVDGVAAVVDCASLFVPAASSLVCSYTAGDGLDGDETLNTATATFNGIDFSGTAAVSYTANVIRGTATLTDDQGPLSETLSGGGPYEFTYDGTQNCSSNRTAYGGNGTYTITVDNLAIVSSGGEEQDRATATAEVVCYAPVVSKDASTSYTRDYSWQITKEADPTSHTGFAGDSFQSGYEVAVDQTIGESDFAVSGTITVINPRPDAPMTVSVADSVGGTAATLNCDGPLTVPGGESATCGYSASLNEKSDGTNTATVTLNSVEFPATAGYAFGEPTTVNGYETVNVTDSQPDSSAPWEASSDQAWSYLGDFECPTDTNRYINGVYEYSVPNRAQITETGQFADQNVDITCYIPFKASVVKITDPEQPGGIGSTPFVFDLYYQYNPSDPMSAPVETQALNGPGTVEFATDLTEPGAWTIIETLPEGWVVEDEDTLVCTFTVAYPDNGGGTYTCTFTNIEKGLVNLLKLNDGIVDPTVNFPFGLYDGPNFGAPSGFLDTPLATDTTLDNSSGELTFGGYQLDPLAVYTICERDIPPGWEPVWMIDTDADGIVDTQITPYDPNSFDLEPEDLGNRCIDIGAGTGFAIVRGGTLVLEVDNVPPPGGEARTPGYWKNWSTCSGGNQQYTADANSEDLNGDGVIDGDERIAAGFPLIDDVLPQSLGTLEIDTCEEAVAIFNYTEIGVSKPKKYAWDGAYKLARALLAYKANTAAHAATCAEAEIAAAAGDTLLADIDFAADGSYLKSNHSRFLEAVALAGTLDAYNNNTLCP